jgi:hypothetical protein
LLYSIDTCSLIEAWRQFPPDIAVTFWEEMIPGAIARGELRATREVEVELKRYDDALVRWALDEAQADLFVEVDEEVQLAVNEILETHTALIDAESLRSGADPFVIGLAHTQKCAVVTQERHAKDPKNRPKIPDVCDAYGIPCLDILDLIRDQDWQW